jgi:dipeptidyl aminopeptidase/acylaminoacyl peptidase
MAACLLVMAASAPGQSTDALKTTAERTDYQETTRHDDLIALAQALDARSDAVRLIPLGQSHEGRSIPLLLVADPMVDSPAAAHRSGKLIVLAIGNIHAGEVDGKEALPMLVRELTDQPGHPLLGDLILAVVPDLNPDGNEKIAPHNRPGQNGPSRGIGQRANAQGLDLNRDFVKLEAPETRALVRWINQWNPHIVIDTHTTNGSYHRFLITHAGPKHPATSRSLIDLAHNDLLPAVDHRMDRDHGIKTFPYGNFNRDRTRWVTFGSEPRYATSYVGVRGRIGLLSEAYAYAPFRDRVHATRDFVRAILAEAAARKQAIRATLDQAAQPTQPGQPIAIRSTLAERPQPGVVLGYVEEPGPDGQPRPTDQPKDYPVRIWDDFQPALTVPKPAAYVIPPTARNAAETLRRHGLDVKILREDLVLPAEVYRVLKVERIDRPYQGHRLVLDTEVEIRTEDRTIPAGSFLVDTSGPLGNLAVLLLEPRSEDGLTTWGAFDDSLAPGRDFPVVRLPQQPAYPLLTVALRLSDEPAPSEPRQPTSSPPVRLGGSGLQVRMLPGAAGFERWLDADHFAQLKDGRRWKVHARTGQAEPLEEQPREDRSKLGEALGRLPTIGPETGKSLAGRATLDPTKTGGFVTHEGDLYYARLDGTGAVRLTSTPGAEELAEFSPDGRFVAFVRDNDLYVVDVATATERALTTGGTDRLRHGKADWVYFEEIFNRNWKAYWWSPDSRHIAFLKTDDRMVPTHAVLIDTGPARIVEETAYPRAGEPNPQVQLGIVPIGGGAPRYADLSDYSPDSFLISHVGWWPDASTVYFYGQDRAQTWLDVLTVPTDGGTPTRLFRETTGAWVESLGPITVLNDGTLLIQSERDGWKHLYRYNPDGSLKNRVTHGPWEVIDVPRIDEDKGWVLVHGGRTDGIGSAVYRARLDGSQLELLTPEPGSHAAIPNPDGSLFVDVYSARETPPRAILRQADGQPVRILDNNPYEPNFDPSQPRRQIAQIPARDGFLLEAEIILPPHLDESGATLYPVWLSTYGGPHFPTLREVWQGGRGALISSLANQGVIVFRVDPRSASGKGAISAWTAYKKLGVQELQDLEDALAWLKQRPYVDPNRIGMEGHSYGGFLTAFCLTHSTLFAAGIAGAPVTDWRDYDSIYTERYMDTPQNNPDGYDASSVVKAADKLHGRLLILHGAIDDNVSVRNTMRLIHALQQANKDFELMIYPASRHGIFSPHYQKLKNDFIQRTLGGPRPKSSD